MKKIILILLFAVSYITCYSQTTFEKGYFINNSGERVECYIENLDLIYNPKKFTYKIANDSKKLKASIYDVKVFEIYDIVKYERHNVDIDRSSEIADEISISRKVIFKQEQLFLKVLIEGKATLYQYSESNFLRFFFKKDNDKIEQLVFKSYTDGFSSDIRKNERYKQQLLNSMPCESLSEGRFNNLNYRKSKLSKLFIDYNTCIGSEFKNYEAKSAKKSETIFNLNLKAGARINSFVLQVGNNNGIGDLDFERKTSPYLGMEAEVILPFNNNKWAVIVEPNYVFYNADFDDPKVKDRVTNTDNSANIDYAAINLPVGIRHYMYLNKNSKLFINYSLVFNFTINSKIRPTTEFSNIELNYDDGRSDHDVAIGIGYNYNNKLSIEARLSTGRDLLNNSAGTESYFSDFSLILGYTIF